MLDKYEISLWEDVLKAENGVSWYEEEKVAIIGSNTMTSQYKAVEPKMVQNINGTNTFSFKIFYNYIDTETGEKVTNPFIDLLINERKVKVFWKNKWYDLVIKSIDENSYEKSITYICKDQYITELSKTGFEIELNNELQNNQGTVVELAEKVVEGTDWYIGQSDIIKQKVEEPLFKFSIGNNLSVENILSKAEATIPIGNFIYVFYSEIQNRNSEFQLFWDSEEKYETDINSQLLTDDTKIYETKNISWIEENGVFRVHQNGNLIFSYDSSNQNVDSQYRGERFVKKQKQEFDSLTRQYCYLYDYNGNEVYGIEKTDYKDPTVVVNLVSNNSNFSSTKGWIGNGLTWTLYPQYDENSGIDYSPISLMYISGELFNSGLQDYFSYIPEGVQIGEKYVARLKVKNALDSSYASVGPSINVVDWEINNSQRTAVSGSEYFELNATSIESNWIEYNLTAIKTATRSELLSKNISLYVDCGNNSYWLEEMQFFSYVEGENDEGDVVRINPGEMDKQSIATVYYKYYLKNGNIISEDDIVYLYSGTEPWPNNNLTPIYNNNFEKIRSIEVKNSNRFNILQTLAETFECWVKFEIDHDETGKIVYDENHIPRKRIYFVEEVGDFTGLSFKYGVDLQSIQRDINSEQITTKVIVSPNNNEFAENGFCEISRSKENYSGENFIYNFDYYISQGLIDGDELNRDLYLSPNGYYFNLHINNKEYREITDFLSIKKNELLKQESLLTVYRQYETSLEEEISGLKTDLIQLTGVSGAENLYQIAVEAVQNGSHKEDEKAKSIYSTILQQSISLANYRTQKQNIEKSVASLNTLIESKEERQEEIIEGNKKLHLAFYKKYSRFIQEGSWISEEYIDEDLYYLDAQSIAYTSSRPQISYSISVVRLSSLEEFRNKIFDIGDIAYVEDTEFFGYLSDMVTPYKEKILVSEITSYFDSPEKDIITVQNYKTQFEDLFQRITSTTQSLQYASGSYQKVAGIVNADGTINKETLQNSFNINKDLVFSAQNESVLQDNTGITLINLSDPTEMTKITSGGLFISIDGGKTWKNAVRGEGIATKYLTAGSINTENITILDGASPTFRWDKNGISAYDTWQQEIDGQLVTTGTKLNKFVRFDKFGIYGYNDSANTAETFVPSSEDEIKAAADFGLLWSGFFMKNRSEDGSIEISNEKDIVVYDADTNQRIKIGRLETVVDYDSEGNPIYNYHYGIRLKDQEGNTTLETKDDGTLWLEDKLNIQNSLGNSIQIGYLHDIKPGTSIHETINVNDKFIVYEDGSMKATDGEFTGTITAEGSKIGDMTVDELIDGINSVNNTKRAEIIADKGTTFKIDSNNQVSPNELSFRVISTNFIIPIDTDINWFGSSDFETWIPLADLIEGESNHGLNKQIVYEKISDKFVLSNFYLKIEVSNENETYVDTISINRVLDGKEPILLVISSTSGNMYINGNISATLRVTAYQGQTDVTNRYAAENFLWKKYDENGILDETWTNDGNNYGTSITIDGDDVYKKATFSCELV